MHNERRNVMVYVKPGSHLFTRLNIYHHISSFNNAPINIKPEGRGTKAYVGHLITFAISTLESLTESLGPRVGMFDFFGEHVVEGGMEGGGGRDHVSHKLNRAIRVSRAKKRHFHE